MPTILRSKSMMLVQRAREEQPRNRLQRALTTIRMAVVLGLAATTLTSCTLAGADFGVYVVRTPSGTPGRVGEPAGVPVWSPTDDTVIWANEDGLFLRPPDGSIPANLFESAVAGRPAWSPDGKLLAFIDRDRASLVVMTPDSGIVRFTESVANESIAARFPTLLTLGGPSWAPDGSVLAYVCWDGAGDEVCLIQADGSHPRQITHLEPSEKETSGAVAPPLPAAANAGPPVWSPDGEFLAVAAYPERGGAPRGVFIIGIEHGSTRRVSTLLPNSAISWFPDGDSILFSATQEGRSDALQVSVRDSVERRLTAGLPDGARDPVLSPDQARLAVERGGEIVVLDLQGGTLEYAVPSLRATHPAWNFNGTAIAFSADVDPMASFN